ncbi:unnamed protein product, partial [marine sediment metagenome]
MLFVAAADNPIPGGCHAEPNRLDGQPAHRQRPIEQQVKVWSAAFLKFEEPQVKGF